MHDRVEPKSPCRPEHALRARDIRRAHGSGGAWIRREDGCGVEHGLATLQCPGDRGLVGYVTLDDLETARPAERLKRGRHSLTGAHEQAQVVAA